MKVYVLTAVFFLSSFLVGQIATPPLSGDGSTSSPYEIASLENLYWIAAPDSVVPSPDSSARWSSNYIQTADIDASATSAWFPKDSGGYYGWSPVGTSSVMFSGSYDGNGFIIQSLYISRDGSDYIGLFGYMSGNLTNVGLINHNVTGRYDTGALCGRSHGTIDNCYADGLTTGYERSGGLIGHAWSNAVTVNSYTKGTVTGSGGNSVAGLTGFNRGEISYCYSEAEITGHGGLVGVNSGTIYGSYASGSLYGSSSVGGFAGGNSGTITDCYAIGAAGGNNTGDVGGFIGMNQSTGTISECYAAGNAAGGHNAGGFAGKNEGTIQNSSASGQVTGSRPQWANRTGGFAGHNRLGFITDCYARGNVTRTHEYTDQNMFGGFAGINDQGSIKNSYSTGSVLYYTGTPLNNGFAGMANTGGNYEMTGNFWDVETSLQTTTAGEAEGKTTAEMKTQSTFTNAGWDFTNLWGIDGENNMGYPFLKWQYPPPQTPGQFTIDYSNQDPLLTWEHTEDYAYYRIYSSTDPHAPFPSENWTLEEDNYMQNMWTDQNTTETKKFYVVVAVK